MINNIDRKKRVNEPKKCQFKKEKTNWSTIKWGEKVIERRSKTMRWNDLNVFSWVSSKIFCSEKKHRTTFYSSSIDNQFAGIKMCMRTFFASIDIRCFNMNILWYTLTAFWLLSVFIYRRSVRSLHFFYLRSVWMCANNLWNRWNAISSHLYVFRWNISVQIKRLTMQNT